MYKARERKKLIITESKMMEKKKALKISNP